MFVFLLKENKTREQILRGILAINTMTAKNFVLAKQGLKKKKLGNGQFYMFKA